MDNILAFSLATISFLFLIIAVSKSVIHSDLGTHFIKYEKNEYGIENTVLLLFAIHILAILLVIFFSPFNNWF